MSERPDPQWYTVVEKDAPSPEEKRVRRRVPPTPPHTCSTCPFYHDLSGGDGAPVDLATGRPLTLYKSLCKHSPDWKVRQGGDWCGQHPLVQKAIADNEWPLLRPGFHELFELAPLEDETTSEEEAATESEESSGDPETDLSPE